ncbi:MAG: Na(+)-translocating NADH-quinone reductase subunit A [Paludibacteraceae bacterium]
MKTIKLKKGLDIAIDGRAELRVVSMPQPEVVKVVPDDYHGIIPKVAVKEGDAVKVGTVLLFDKNRPTLKITSPISGTVIEVARGERRKLLYVAVQRDGKQTCEKLEKIDLNAERKQVLTAVLDAGFGALIRQRPYDVVANPETTPKAIFVSAFDSAPLAPDYNFVLQGRAADVQAGLSTLAKLTDGKVYYSVAPNTAVELRNMKDVEINEFAGAHPAGNVGVQINRLNPVNKGETVWTMNVQDVALLGHFARTGTLDMERLVAVAGPEVVEPAYVRTLSGTSIAAIVNCDLSRGIKVRVINGNVLTGTQADENTVLSPFAGVVSAIAEGDEADEMFGWLSPRFHKFSNSLSYPWRRLFGCFNIHYDYDARILGGRRAIIMSGEYDKVFPMDILPEPLIKAMIAKNLDKMEQLGAYEVAPEDFALCEFVCTSKLELQKIVREALDYMRKELE